MKHYLFLLGCLLLTACKSNDNPKEYSYFLTNALNGLWKGQITQFMTKEFEDSRQGEQFDVIFLNCNGEKPQIWMKTDSEGYFQIYEEYKVISKSGNHMLYLIYDGDGWVETQSWGFVSVSPFVATVQWSRMVSNRYHTATSDTRSFGQMGYGKIEKVQENCSFDG